MKKGNVGVLGCVGIVLFIGLLIRFWYIIVIGLGIMGIFIYKESIKEFYNKKPQIVLLVGCLTIAFLIIGIAATEVEFSDNHNSSTEKVAKTSDNDSDEKSSDSEESDIESSDDESSNDNEESDTESDDDYDFEDVDDESSNSDENSNDSSGIDTDSASTDNDVKNSSNVTSSSSSTTTVASSTTGTGEWQPAPSGMVYVSDSNLYYSMVKNPDNFASMSPAEAEAQGAHRAPRGNEYARP